MASILFPLLVALCGADAAELAGPDPSQIPFALSDDQRTLRLRGLPGPTTRTWRLQQALQADDFGMVEVWAQVDQTLVVVKGDDGLEVELRPRVVDLYANSDFGRVDDKDVAKAAEMPTLRWTEGKDGPTDLTVDGGRAAEILQASLGPASGFRLPQPPGAIAVGEHWEHGDDRELRIEIEDRLLLMELEVDARYDFVGWFERDGETYALVHSQVLARYVGRTGFHDIAGVARGSSWVALRPQDGVLTWTAGQLTLAQGDDDGPPDRINLLYTMGPVPTSGVPESFPPRIPKR